jgi:hypothetical protein
MSIPKELYNLKFAEYMQSIKILYLTDDRFKSLCEQYCNSKIDMENHNTKMIKTFASKVKVENLVIGLEEEILIYLIRKSWR